MGYNESEFYRISPTAPGEYQHITKGNKTTVSYPDKEEQLILDVIPLPNWVLGAFRIQRIDVQFQFLYMDAATRSQFMQRFDRRYQ